MKYIVTISFILCAFPTLYGNTKDCGDHQVPTQQLNRDLQLLMQLQYAEPKATLAVNDEIAHQAKLLVEGYIWLIRRKNAYDLNTTTNLDTRTNNEDRETATREFNVAIKLLRTLSDSVLVSWTNRLLSAIREQNTDILKQGQKSVSTWSVLAIDPWDDGTGLRNKGVDRTLTDIARIYEKQVLDAGKGEWRFEFDCEDAFRNIVIVSRPERDTWYDMHGLAKLIEGQLTDLKCESRVIVEENKVIWRVRKRSTGREDSHRLP